MTRKQLLGVGVGIAVVSGVVLRALYATGDFKMVTAVCELRQSPDDGGRAVFYSQQVRALRYDSDSGVVLLDGGRTLRDGGDVEQQYPGLSGGLWVLPDALIDDDSTPIRCIEVADDPSLAAGQRRLIQGLCACSPYLPDGGHPAACQWDMTDGGWTKAPGDRTLDPGHWRGACVEKVCVILDGDQGTDMPATCTP